VYFHLQTENTVDLNQKLLTHRLELHLIAHWSAMLVPHSSVRSMTNSTLVGKQSKAASVSSSILLRSSSSRDITPGVSVT
jgi:hypothetical protein